MAIFNKPGPDRAVGGSDPSAGDAAMSVIGNGMRIVGDVDSNGTIKVEGVVEGTVRGARQLLLGRSGVIHGDVHAADAIIAGRIVGMVVAQERVEIQGTASVDGDIHTRSIVVHEGASINGGVRMGEAAQASRPPAGVRLHADG